MGRPFIPFERALFEEDDDDEDEADIVGRKGFRTLGNGPSDRYECVDNVKSLDSGLMERVIGGGVLDI